MADPALREQVRELARAAGSAATLLRGLTREAKDAALHTMADALTAAAPDILAANAQDLEAAQAAGTADAQLDRLRLNTARVEGMAAGLRELAALPDPVGVVLRGSRLPNGLELRQVSVPIGVIAIVYEARPNVTVDAAGLCLKSGNAVLLRGSGSAQRSNAALVEVLSAAAAKAGLPEAAIILIPGAERESVTHLLQARGLVDVVIPRGGAGLISHVVEHSLVPVIETGVGNCHVYVDGGADLDMAVDIVLDAKTTRPSVCNAAETVLVHADIAGTAVPRLVEALHRAGVTVHGDATVAGLAEGIQPAGDDDWATEYLSLDIAMAVVDDLGAALAHIQAWGTGHTEAIVTGSQPASRAFIAGVDAAVVMVNASTRFTDGAEFGFGAEIGISTQKLHARGPMGLAELTTSSYVVVGDGHVRG